MAGAYYYDVEKLFQIFHAFSPLFFSYFFSYSFSLFFFVIFFFFVYCVVGFWFYFYFLGRGPGFFALGSCGKPQRGRKATAPLHTPRAFFLGVLGLWCGVRC
ncbi:MAG: hypothetical protein EGS62_04455 [Ruminococcus sp.]|nr:hypothetical protein [Ruminococcus sp.]